MKIKSTLKIEAAFALALLSCPVVKAWQNSPLDKVSHNIAKNTTMVRWPLGATVPYGQIEVCPDSKPCRHQSNGCVESAFSGFCLRSFSDTDTCSCVEYVSLMPDMTGKEVYLQRHTEQIHSGYYSVTLSNGVMFTATAERRMAVERFSFSDASKAVLLLNPHSVSGKISEAIFEQKKLTMGQGLAECVDTNGNRHGLLHYRLYTNSPFVSNMTKEGYRRLTFPNLTARYVEVRIVVADSANELEAMTEEQVWQTDFLSILDNAKDLWESALDN